MAAETQVGLEARLPETAWQRLLQSLHQVRGHVVVDRKTHACVSRSRNSRRLIFPLGVLGNSATNSTLRGYL